MKIQSSRVSSKNTNAILPLNDIRSSTVPTKHYTSTLFPFHPFLSYIYFSFTPFLPYFIPHCPQFVFATCCCCARFSSDYITFPTCCQHLAKISKTWKHEVEVDRETTTRLDIYYFAKALACLPSLFRREGKCRTIRLTAREEI